MARHEELLDQIVFRWEADNSMGTTGFGPVAWSNGRDTAETVFRHVAPLLRTTAAETVPALIRLERKGRALLIHRAALPDPDGQPSAVCHALTGASATLDAETCLGLHAWSWENGGLRLGEVRGGLEQVRTAAVLESAEEGRRALVRGLPALEETLKSVAAEVLRRPGQKFTVLDREGGKAAHRVLWGLYGIFRGLHPNGWTFATHDTIEERSIQFVFVRGWAGPVPQNTERTRMDPGERLGDRAEEVAGWLVDHYLRGVEQGEEGEFSVSEALTAAASRRSHHRDGGALLDVAEEAVYSLRGRPRRLYTPESGRSEPVRDEPTGGERSRGESLRGETSRGDRGRPDSGRPGSVRGDSARPDPVRSDSVRAESLRPDSGRGDSVRAEPSWSEPTHTEPVRSEPPRTEPVRSEPVRSEPPRTEPLHSEPVRSDPVRSDPVRSDPIRSEPPRAEPPPRVPSPSPSPSPSVAPPPPSVSPPPSSPPALPRVVPEWPSSAGSVGLIARRRLRRGTVGYEKLVAVLRTLEEPNAVQKNVVRTLRVTSNRDLIQVLREGGLHYAAVTLILKETAARYGEWGKGLRLSLCFAVLDRKLFVAGRRWPASETRVPREETQAANAAALYQWVVRPQASRDSLVSGRLTTLLPELSSGPDAAGRAAVQQILEAENGPGIRDEVWLALLRAERRDRTRHQPEIVHEPSPDHAPSRDGRAPRDHDPLRSYEPAGAYEQPRSSEEPRSYEAPSSYEQSSLYDQSSSYESHRADEPPRSYDSHRADEPPRSHESSRTHEPPRSYETTPARGLPQGYEPRPERSAPVPPVPPSPPGPASGSVDGDGRPSRIEDGRLIVLTLGVILGLAVLGLVVVLAM
nr:hypothetical protein OH820_28070 [Streptomyces sp. NBC_00857]